MRQETILIIDRLKRGNAKAASRVGAAHFQALIADVKSMGEDAFVEMLSSMLNSKTKTASAPKSENEQRADKMRRIIGVNADRLRELVLDAAQKSQALPADLPRTQTKNLSVLVRTLNKSIGDEKTRKLLADVEREHSPVH